MTGEELVTRHPLRVTPLWRDEMEPTRNARVTLVDLLDRVLEKGLVIHADVIISVAGIPLIGVNLRAALASMETMVKYGVMQDWDERSRAWEREHRKKKEIPLLQGEAVLLKMLGSHYYSKGIYITWRSGHFYLTDKRLMLYHSAFDEILFEVRLEEVKALVIKEMKLLVGKGTREELFLVLQDDRVARLHALDTHGLKETIEGRIAEMGLQLEEHPILPELEERTAKFLTEGEKVVCSGKIWHFVPGEGILGTTWKPGCLYLTDKRLCWWYDFERRIIFETPIDSIVASVAEIRDLSTVMKSKRVLDLIYSVNGTREVATFSGPLDSLQEWNREFNKIIAKEDIASIEERETCPQCGREAPARELLEKGCSTCGWVSPKLRRQLAQAVVS